ncbi:MAG: DUF4199 domain-containing protein [Bacteroidota bacterium]|nr:DUF4199 domain-containing protein [Bacteroidota bacterium]
MPTETHPVSVRAVGLKYGLIGLALLVIYFFIMQAMNMTDRPFFRIFNHVAMALAIFLAYRDVTHKLHTHRISYLPGLGVGIWITIFTGITFGIFVLIYAGIINPAFVSKVAPELPFADYLNPGSIAFVAAAELMVVGLISSFVFMQFFKRNRKNEELDEAEEHVSYNQVKKDTQGTI